MNNDEFTNNDVSEEHNSIIQDGVMPKIEDNDESEKYTREMYDFADKNKFKNTITFFGISAVIVSVIVAFIVMNTIFMKPKPAIATNKTVPSKTIANPTINNTPPKVEEPKPLDTNAKIYEYLNVEANRTAVLQKATQLNKGSQKGVTVYLLSEILRANAITIPDNTNSVELLLKTLTSTGWKKSTDFTQLQKGDICFTTDMPQKPGVPSHVYIFMGWVVEGKTDFGNICDGQIEQFSNMLHKRNISVTTTDKDKFGFFLRK